MQKIVTFLQYENSILITIPYSDGSIKGEFKIINTPLGFQLQAYYDSWRIFNDCNDLFDLLSSASMSGITMKMLAEMIKDIGYELKIL